MNIRELMTDDIAICSPGDSLRDAASAMKKIDTGVLPVGENDRLQGMITDRDIAVRAVAANRGPETEVRDVMTDEVLYCFDDQDPETVARQMSDLQIRRMPVVDRDKRLVGMISLGDLTKAKTTLGAAALSGVTEPGGKHVQ